MRAKLNQCRNCSKTYNMNEVGTTEKLCCNCNEKYLIEFRKKDALRKREGRSSEVSTNLEKLAGLDV